MADRNNNGIDDSREGGLVSALGRNKTRTGIRKEPSLFNTRPAAGSKGVYREGDRYGGLGGFFANLSNTAARGLVNWWDTDVLGNQRPIGGGAGDAVFGAEPGTYGSGSGLSRSFAGRGMKSAAQQQDTSLPSFLENLMTALGYVGEGSSMDRVNYDPLRQDAQSRGTEYDARLNAMYNQLQGSIRDDGTALQGSYQQAIDSNAARSAEAQQQTQGAGDAAQARNLQQLQALGIGDAAGNIVAEGRDLNTQVAQAVQDAAARGQISGNALSQNQQSAAQHNTNLVGAAGLEGNLQRARVQSELASLLAQYDMQEQQANQEVDQFNASQRNSGLGQAMGLASALTDDQWTQQSYADQLAQAQLAGSQPNTLSQSMSFLQQLMGSPQFQGQSIEEILPYIQALGSVGKLM